MGGRAAHWVDALRTQLWPLPAVAVALAVLLGTALPALDSNVDSRLPESVSVLLFSGGPEAARSVLQAISGSLITVTSLTFSLTVVTLQLASSQFSPRLLRTFSADRFVHGTLALFLAAFAYALTVLRSVRDESNGNSPFVPEISVTVAFALAVASVMALVLFLAHLTKEIRVETMMGKVAAETRETMTRVFPENRPTQGPEPRPGPGGFQVKAASSGFFTSFDKEALLQAAVESGTVVRLDREPGSSLVQGVPFATAWPLEPGARIGPEKQERLSEAVNAAVTTGIERTSVQDPGFGFRQLVDVAAKALSPGINDPTTAVHVLGHLSALLCQLVHKETGPEHLTDDHGAIRVVLALPALPDLLGMTMNQTRLYGAADPVVAERLLDLLHELASCDAAGRYTNPVLDHLQRTRDAIATASYPIQERQGLLQKADAAAAAVQSRPEK